MRGCFAWQSGRDAPKQASGLEPLAGVPAHPNAHALIPVGCAGTPLPSTK